jgi:hypothetical protein
MNDFAKILQGLEKDADGLGLIFTKITSEGEGAALTLEDLNKLKDKDLGFTTENGTTTFNDAQL